jgi:hypothetical protein
VLKPHRKTRWILAKSQNKKIIALDGVKMPTKFQIDSLVKQFKGITISKIHDGRQHATAILDFFL